MAGIHRVDKKNHIFGSDYNHNFTVEVVPGEFSLKV